MSELEQAPVVEQGIIDEKELNRANAILQEYRDGKKPIDQRIEEAERWWLLKQWEVYDKNAKGAQAGGANDRRTASAWLFNAIVGAQADAVEAYPEPIILPREQGDEEQAEMLSKILPVILQQNGFEETYSKAQWQKMKTGTGAYGVFWDKSALNGLGDISIRRVNMLNLFYQPGIDDIQASQNLFHTEMVDRKYLISKYPHLKGKNLDSFNAVKPKTEEKVKTDDLVEVIDWYYHRVNMHGQEVLHYAKYCGTALIYATENDIDPVLDDMGNMIREAPAVTGLYEDNEYPFDLDPLYPIDGSPTGLGMVYIGKSAQENIDRLQTKIIETAIMGANVRYFSYGNSINETEFADWEGTRIVHVNGSNGREDVEQIQSPKLDSMFVQIRNDLIEELKQTLGMTDVTIGQASSGVTAASAYAILDENAGKPKRASSRGSYRMYSRLINRVIERIRQFYDAPRTFRIMGASGEKEFVNFDNQGIAMRPQQGETDLFEKPVFDIEVRAQKQNVYTRMAQNEMAIQFFQMGVFNPQMADQALKMIDLMDFKDKEKIIQQIKEAMMLTDQLKRYQELALALTAQYNPQMYEPLMQEIMATDPIAAQAVAQPVQPVKKQDNINPRPNEAGNVAKARAKSQAASQPQ
jgi:hypothetical protein